VLIVQMSWLPCMHFSNWIKFLVHKFLKWFVKFLKEKLLTTLVCKYALRNNLTSDFYFWFLCLVFVLSIPYIFKIVHVFCKFRNLNLSTNSKQWAYLLYQVGQCSCQSVTTLPKQIHGTIPNFFVIENES